MEISQRTFNNQHAIVLLGGAGLLLIIIVIVTTIRGYVYRPRTIEDHLKLFPDDRRHKLEALATTADERRRRRTQPALSDRLREDSVQTVNYEANTDNEYNNYYGIDNASMDTLTE